MITDLTTDVVIVGGGPNGLLLACELILAGVHPVVLERLPERSVEPKANGLVGQVLRFLDHRGLHERLGGGPGAPRPVPHFVFGAFPLPLGELDDNPLSILQVPQLRMEEVLEDRAAELGVTIRRGHELTSLRQDEDGVTVDVRGPDGDYRLRTRYLVGCDGGRSAVRKQAGIAFPGVTGPDLVSRSAHATLPASMVVPETGELDVPGHGRIRPFTHTRTEHGVFVFAALPPSGVPLVSTIEWGPSPQGEDEPMTVEEMSASAGRVLGADLPLAPPPSSGPRMLRRLVGRGTRLAERYRSGRVLLAGDSAHVHSAVGGPGLNLGLQDVANLGWKLAAEVHGWAPPGLLDTYHDERHPVGRRVFMHTQAQTALMAPGPEITQLRELFGELLRSKANIRHIAELMAGTDTRYPTTDAHPLSGRFAPDLRLDTATSGTETGTTRLAELMRSGRPLLLRLSGDQPPADVADGWKDRVDVITARCPNPPADAILIRPDGYVAWAAAPGESPTRSGDGLRLALTTWFGRPGSR
ncbi:FAD-dependent monooxygenase [Streptomyces sp. NPDC096339]|uniref:FAD-dependent monooxygenase n=1 Tax=Streptomyces sp. NPDC096339 TaxID=3366086 RepID=UPI00382064AF